VSVGATCRAQCIVPNSSRTQKAPKRTGGGRLVGRRGGVGRGTGAQTRAGGSRQGGMGDAHAASFTLDSRSA
jgi:hypothetical protein